MIANPCTCKDREPRESVGGIWAQAVSARCPVHGWAPLSPEHKLEQRLRQHFMGLDIEGLPKGGLTAGQANELARCAIRVFKETPDRRGEEMYHRMTALYDRAIKRERALRAELEADLRLWGPLIEDMDTTNGLTSLLRLRVASIMATLEEGTEREPQ